MDHSILTLPQRAPPTFMSSLSPNLLGVLCQSIVFTVPCTVGSLGTHHH